MQQTMLTESETTVRPLRLAVVVGSTREGRFAPTITEWVLAGVAERTEIEASVVDVGRTELPHTFGAPAPSVEATRTVLAAADAFVVITPEYNHSYPGSLKNLIDLHFEEWQAKPVGFVSYGGISGGLRAVEHLRGVFAELHAVTVRDTVSFHHPWSNRDDAGKLVSEKAADEAAAALLDQLIWWGEVLRAGRASRPYGS